MIKLKLCISESHKMLNKNISCRRINIYLSHIIFKIKMFYMYIIYCIYMFIYKLERQKEKETETGGEER